MNAGLRTLEINVQHFNDDLSRAAMATDSLVAADSTVLDPGQEEQESDGIKIMQMAIHIMRSCSATPRIQHLRVARLVMVMMQIGRIDDHIIEVEYDNRSGRDSRTPI